ncbi:MAG: sugar ABC transporter permease [Proteobacteria bacterium]|nr:sugar ABC transporter permease [Pseudomonadota bacterium]MBI3496206.1 sugar ABC transporter permease [Pseudomonadota bacterium]
MAVELAQTRGVAKASLWQAWLRWRAGPQVWFIMPAVVVLLGVYAGPMLYALHASFTHWVLVDPGSMDDPAGLSNYQDVLTNREFWTAVRVTVTYAAGSIACGLTLGTAFALLLNLDFFWRSFFRSVMMIPMVVTPAVIGIFWKLLYEQESGVFNWVLVAIGLPSVPWLDLNMALPSMIVMDVWQTTPFFMLVILAGLQSIDENLLGAAKVDGASPVQLFRYILLPHLLPYMMIAASFRCIAAMGDFDKIWLLTSGGPGDRTTTITIFTYKTGFSAFDIGRTAAIAWIFVAIVMTVSAPLLQRLFKSAMAER